jgi:hypothetical protein
MGLLHDNNCGWGELNLIGAGIGGGFVNTKELHVMKYKEAMTTNARPTGRRQSRRSMKGWSITKSSNLLQSQNCLLEPRC